MSWVKAVLLSVLFLAACAGGAATTLDQEAMRRARIGAGDGGVSGARRGSIRDTTGKPVREAHIRGRDQAQERQAVVQPAPVSPPPPLQVPPPPATGPLLRFEPAWGLYVVDAHSHILFYEGRYFYWDGRMWYTAIQWGGPWAAVQVIPVPVAQVPPGHLRDGPPPWAGPKKQKHGRKRWE